MLESIRPLIIKCKTPETRMQESLQKKQVPVFSYELFKRRSLGLDKLSYALFFLKAL